MTVAFDNFNSTDNVAATSQVFGSAVTFAAGARAYIGIRANGTTAQGNLVTNVTDSASGAWTFQSYNDNNNVGNSLVVWRCLSCPGGSTTITVTLSSSQAMRATVASYTGATSEEGQINALVTGTNLAGITSGNITTSGASRLIIGICCDSQQATTITPGGSETARGTIVGRLQMQDVPQSAPGTYTTSWVFTGGTAPNAVTYYATALFSTSSPTDILLPIGGKQTFVTDTIVQY